MKQLTRFWARVDNRTHLVPIFDAEMFIPNLAVKGEVNIHGHIYRIACINTAVTEDGYIVQDVFLLEDNIK